MQHSNDASSNYLKLFFCFHTQTNRSSDSLNPCRAPCKHSNTACASNRGCSARVVMPFQPASALASSFSALQRAVFAPSHRATSRSRSESVQVQLTRSGSRQQQHVSVSSPLECISVLGSAKGMGARLRLISLQTPVEGNHIRLTHFRRRSCT